MRVGSEIGPAVTALEPLGVDAILLFIGNLVYVGIAVVGGLQVATGAMQLGDVQAFIQYSRQFTMPLAQLGSMANLLQSGVASAERILPVLRRTAGGGGWCSRTSRSPTRRTSR